MQCSEDIAAPALVMEGGGLSSVETGAGVQLATDCREGGMCQSGRGCKERVWTGCSPASCNVTEPGLILLTDHDLAY